MSENREIAIQIEGLKKRYRLGTIGGGTLVGDIQSWWARVRKKEDPTLKIGAKKHDKHETFMALDGIDLTIYKGERIGIIGHNGAGKSTLLKLLSRVTGPTEGEIRMNGRVSSMLEVGTGFNGELTGRENIYINGAILGMTKAEIDAKMDQIIEFSECAKFIDTPVKRYSSGMYVKLAFSVAAHLDSEILIMDEVLAVGDMQFQKKCLNKMGAVSKEEGRTVLYVSHNMNTIRQLCERCIVLDHGKIIFNGDVEEAIAIYLGNNMNTLPAHYDLKDTVRPSKQHGSALHINTFDFLDKKMASYKNDEKLRFSINFTVGDKDIEDLQIYLVFNSDNGQIVGMTQTLETGLEVKAGETYTFIYEMDISNLSGGKYYFIVDYFAGDGNGTHYSVDHPMENIVFEAIDVQGKWLKWKKRYYGNVKLNPLEVV